MDGGGSIPDRWSSMCKTRRQDGAWMIQREGQGLWDIVRKAGQVMSQERMAEEVVGLHFGKSWVSIWEKSEYGKKIIAHLI